jgi:hypothetical protein
VNAVPHVNTDNAGRQSASKTDLNQSFTYAVRTAWVAFIIGCALLAIAGVAASANAQEPSAEASAGGSAALNEGSVRSAAVTPEPSRDTAPLADAPIAMTLAIPTGDLSVGQRVDVVATVDIQPGENVSGFTARSNRFVEVLAFTQENDPDGQPSNRWIVSLAVFRPGLYESDGLSARVLRLDGTLAEAVSEPFALNVVSGIINESDPQLTPSARPSPVVTLDWRVVYMLGAAAAALVGAIIALAVRRVRRPKVEPPPPPKRPAWDIALESLNALHDADLLGQGERLQYHMRLSEILRTFVGDVLGVPAVESTTSEIESFLERHTREVGRHGAEITRILEDTDLVKFARFTPPDDMSLALYSRTRAVVRELAERAQELSANMEQVEQVPDPPPAESRDPDGGVP